jgi:hypothetical protein
MNKSEDAESREKSLKEARQEIENIKRSIDAAVDHGEVELRCDYLLLGTKLWLKENGYRYQEFRMGGAKIYWG